MPRRSAASNSFAVIPGSPPPRLRPPSELTTIERRIFTDIVNHVKPTHFQPSDMPLLVAYVRSIALERSSAKALATGKDKGALSRWSQATKTMYALSLRLRLSPQARAPNNPGRPAKPHVAASYYDRSAVEEGDES
jgi:hypothetical protein